ncbi:NAC domain-containing protein JA2-like [Alnus glutinosa]|uniref:NAC domain-containing protein JA2-like n=1 Tax=Alnus glutinosa TaxID=3517 RepID=UPI002D7969AA|nr:NAC domain-containing protein JA2-like [Alnus glutinosa]XP_062175572.1 NAC domain-containing protein JA2-like [Alnus glutinosa]
MAAFLPAGFRFCPSDEELVRDYLLKKAMGEELPWDGIGECDLYGEKPPWEICGDQEGEKVYFFAKLRKLNKSRVARTAGSGVWHENSSHHIYDEEGDVIGARKLFCFKVKDGSTMKRSEWIMHEFSLVGEHEPSTSWVLCTLQKKGSESRIGIKRRREDGSQQRKRICCETVQSDGPPAKYGSPYIDLGTHMEGTPDTDLVTQMEFGMHACDNSNSEFDLETFMNIVPPEGGDLPQGTLEDFWDGDICTLFA